MPAAVLFGPQPVATVVVVASVGLRWWSPPSGWRMSTMALAIFNCVNCAHRHRHGDVPHGTRESPIHRGLTISERSLVGAHGQIGAALTRSAVRSGGPSFHSQADSRARIADFIVVQWFSTTATTVHNRIIGISCFRVVVHWRHYEVGLPSGDVGQSSATGPRRDG